MEDFFYSIRELSRRNKIILSIDEFKQIATIQNLKLDKMLRKNIHERENVSYFFLGFKSIIMLKTPQYFTKTHLTNLFLK